MFRISDFELRIYGRVMHRGCFYSWSLFLIAVLFSEGVLAGEALPVKVEEAWVRAVPASLTDTAAFMRLENTGDTPVRLTGGKSQIAGMAMLMETTRKMAQGAEVLGMKGVDYIEIPPHGERVLKPGGDHLMLMNLTAHPRIGEKVEVILEFEPGHRTVTVEMPVRMDD